MLLEKGMDLASEYLFGQSFESLLSKPRIDVARFSAAVEKSLKGVQRRVVLSSLLRLLPKDHIWHRAYSEVNELFDRYIDLAIEEQKSPPKTGEPLPDASATDRPFIMLRELLKETQNRHFLRNQLTTVFLPMYQAAPFGLGDIFFQLARAPGTWAKLRAEALEMGDTQLTFEVLKSMTYLQCVIKESQCAAPSLSECLKGFLPPRH